MKIFVYILCLYFIGLTMVPCADQVQEATAINITGTQDKGHSDEHQDYCSPFCICSCCSTVLNIEQTNTISFIIVLLESKRKIAYETNLYSFDYSSIWQPPQLA
ncbi:DUF6660 family protein [Sphingobacterium faecium]|uniref:DUF6660 family protein n=1 Tax=Sphingobacterium faecium TaxID=34087 RepID=UPI003D363AE0